VVLLALTLVLSLCHLHSEMVPAMVAVEAVWGPKAIVTSDCGGKHMVGSKHYQGYALDFRTRHIPKRKQPALAFAVGELLGNDYDVVLEVDHLHVEFQGR